MIRRGQATVETVLGLLVAIPIVVALLSFCELGFASLKVKEAGYALLWDVPAHRTHDLNAQPRKWDVMTSQNTLETRSALFTQRYQSLRGLGSESGNPNVFLRVNGVDLRCEDRPRDAQRFEPTAVELYLLLPIYGGAGSAVRCRASAAVQLAGVPDFQIALFGEPILPTRTFTLCGTRAPDGSCGLGPTLLTDTWAFTNKQENDSCLVASCANPAVKRMALEAMGNVPASTFAMRMASLMGVLVPYPDPNATFAGSEYNFLDGLDISHGATAWAPTPFMDAYQQRSYTQRKEGYPGIDLANPLAGLSP